MSDKIREALEGMLAIHDEPSGFAGKYGRALDEAIAAQKAKIDQRIAAARTALAQQPAPAAVPDGITLERIERHAQPAGGCPSSARVVLLSSLKRLFAAAPAAPVAHEPHTFWVLFDATAEQRFIKKMLPEGFLAFFDCERDARLAKARNPGTDYKRIDYYTAPPAAEQPDTVKVSRELLEELVDIADASECFDPAERGRHLLAGGEA